MKKTILTGALLAMAGVGVMAGSAGTASALPLATYTHNYGSGTGQVDPGGNDVLSNGYVTVSDRSTNRFNDSFDFSSLSYDTITSFDLTLTYSLTDSGTFWWFPLEAWYARPGGTPDQFTSFPLNLVGNTATSQTFRIDNTLQPEFANMVAAENFFFWFAEETVGRDEFRLSSAALSVDGSAPAPVPEPATMLLFGTGLAGLIGAGRRRKK